MDDRTALHTAARRFCAQRYADWMRRYTELQAEEKWQVEDLFTPGWDYSDEAYRTFPRYRVEAAIQVEVESVLPDCEANLEDLRTHLIRGCGVAEARLHEELKNPIARNALREEADDFRAYIGTLNTSDLRSIEPLPYRRVINSDESKRLWDELKQVWNVGDGSWFPLKEGRVPSNVMAFHTDFFESIHGVVLLREALAAHGIHKVFQLQEFGPPEPEYELDVSIFVPSYGNGGEQYSTSDVPDWMVYASHECSVTICGDWLTTVIEDKLPNWSRHTYKGPYSTDDLRGTWDAPKP